MNTLDVKVKIRINSFEDLYKYARKQFLAFEKVEGVIPEAKESCWNTYDFSLECPQDQLRFKDMLQIRFIEELTEASADMKNPDHFFEEITDAFNFFISAYIMVGTNFKELPDPETFLSKTKSLAVPSWINMCISTYKVVHRVGYLCNVLKNRPWSQSNYLVSMIDFNERLKDLWIEFWTYLGLLGMDKETLFDLFAKKLSVNFFRIESNY